MKKEPKILTSPDANVSKSFIEIEQETVNKIKVAIAEGKSIKDVKKIILEGCNKMAKLDKRIANEMYKTLTHNSNVWMYTYRSNITNLNKALYIGIQNAMKKKGYVLKEGSYSIDLTAMLQNNTMPVSSRLITQFRNENTEIKAAVPLIKNYDKIVTSQLKVLASEVPKTTIVKNGEVKISSLRNRIEMKTRYDANMQDLANLKGEGVKLVWTSSHASASPRCAKWQGKLFSLDGTRGEIDGTPYIPLEEALNDNGGNSIINGYNCRHYLIEYRPNSQAPKSYTQAEMKKEYAIDQTQRRYENTIRHLKAEELVFKANGDTAKAKQRQQQINDQLKEYKKFSFKNERPIYRWRCDLMEEEIDDN